MASAPLEFQHAFEPATRAESPFTALLLHGTGANQHDLVPLGRAVAPGAAILSPLGAVREHGMPRWFRRLREGVFDEDDIRRRSSDLAAFLTSAAVAYRLDPNRFVGIGFSNGANIAAALLLLKPGALRGAVLLRAMVPLVPEALPDLSGVPVLIAAGTADPMIPAEGAERLAGLLREAGADVTLRWAEAGHGLLAHEVDEVRAWLAEHASVLSTPRPR